MYMPCAYMCLLHSRSRLSIMDKPIHEAAEKGDLEQVRRLLQADPASVHLTGKVRKGIQTQFCNFLGGERNAMW